MNGLTADMAGRLAKWAKSFEERKRRAEYNAKRIADVLGVKRDASAYAGIYTVHINGKVCGKFHVFNDETTEVDLYPVPIDVALAIAKVIREAS